MDGESEKEAVDQRRDEGLEKIADEVAERRAAGAPAVPSPPVKDVPYKAPRIPPGKVKGATAKRVRRTKKEDEDV